MFLRQRKNLDDARDLYKISEKGSSNCEKKLDVQKHISSFKKIWQNTVLCYKKRFLQNGNRDKVNTRGRSQEGLWQLRLKDDMKKLAVTKGY